MTALDGKHLSEEPLQPENHFPLSFSLVNTYTKETSQVQPQPEGIFCMVGREAETLGQNIFNICGHCKLFNALYTCKE